MDFITRVYNRADPLMWKATWEAEGG